MKIIHVITNLGDGGAEHTLYKICKYDKINNHIVVSLKGPGKYYTMLKKLGTKVYFLNFRLSRIHKFFSLINLIRTTNPDIIQTWLVHADFLGGLAARIAGSRKIIWNIRYSNFDITKTKFLTIFLIKVLAKLSYFIPRYIVSVSKKAEKIYQKKGYDKKKIRFIPNGYDLSILRPIKSKKINFFKRIKEKKNIPIIGNIARYDPKKNHFSLLEALSILRVRNINFFCILAGSNINKYNISLVSEINRLKLHKHVKLLGQIKEIPNVMTYIDVYVQSSGYGEGFPNIVAEAMACKTPCVVTNVGDASLIVGKTGIVVPPNNSMKLSKAIEKMIVTLGTNKWNKIRISSRLRIRNKFSIDQMIRSYNKLWSKLYSE